MMYFVEFKDRNTDQKYVVPTGILPYDSKDVIQAIEAALQTARRLRETYETHYKVNFDDSWADVRKEKFFKINDWSVRVQNDDGKTILLITDKMCF